MEIENHNDTVIMVVGENHQWVLRLVGKSMMRNRIFT